VARQEEHVGLAHFLAGSFADAEQWFKEAHDTLLRARSPSNDGGGVGEGGSQFAYGVWHPDVMRICRNMAIAQCRRGPSRF
jgi:hypothetical protein